MRLDKNTPEGKEQRKKIWLSRIKKHIKSKRKRAKYYESIGK